MSGKNDVKTKLKASDIINLNEILQTKVNDDKLYWLRNDAKMRAVYSAQSYEEFRDVVDAAHLTPLDRQKDKINGAEAKTQWNPIASKTDKTLP